MPTNLPRKDIQYVIGTTTLSRGEMLELEKENRKIGTKYTLETIDVISIFPLVEANHRQPIIKISKGWYIFIQQMNKIIYLKLVI